MIDKLPPAQVPVQTRPSNSPRNRMAEDNFNDWLAKEPAENVVANQAAADSEGEPISVEYNELLVEFHVQTEQGQSEVISLPWRLAANGGLSHIGSIDAVLGNVLDSSAQAITRHLASRHYQGSVADSLGSLATTTEAADVHSHGAPLAVLSVATTSINQNFAATRSTSAAVAAPWLERLIRWIEQQGHDAAVWVRDYRLDDAAAQQVVDTLRAQAREHGLQLDRIVVNARELWRATPRTSEETR